MKKFFRGILIIASWLFAYEITFKLRNFSYKRLFKGAKLHLNLSSWNWKTSKLPLVLLFIASGSFASSLGRDKHSLCPTIRNLTAILSTMFWSSSSDVSRVMSMSREVWTRSDSSFLPHFLLLLFKHWHTCNNQHLNFVFLNMVGSTI